MGILLQRHLESNLLDEVGERLLGYSHEMTFSSKNQEISKGSGACFIGSLPRVLILWSQPGSQRILFHIFNTPPKKKRTRNNMRDRRAQLCRLCRLCPMPRTMSSCWRCRNRTNSCKELSSIFCVQMLSSLKTR